MLVKQLRYYTRFITVCLLLGKREDVMEHLERLQQLVDDFEQEAQVVSKPSLPSFVPTKLPESSMHE